MSIVAYKNFISNFDLKLENGATNFEMLVPNTLINQWEELTFDLTSHIGQTFTRLTIIPDNSSVRSAQRISYWDNISFNSNKANAVETVTNQSVHIFPNPVKTILQVKADREICQIVIYNLVGQIIKSVTVTGHEKNINLSDVTSGNYLLTVKMTDGSVSTQKVVKL